MLAIIIPAYKAIYLRETLVSFTHQTNTHFTLYIGDDASPADLYSIIKPFESKLNIVYKRFEDNLGGKSLIKHWDRCIAMSADEEWIWLFSDDDLVEKDCVQSFYDALAGTNSAYDLYHFNSSIIDGNGQLIQAVKHWERVVAAEDFLSRKLSFQISSFACEYVFRRSSFEGQGFVEFPLAWCSDDATWARIAREKGIYTIGNSSVAWRYSGSNLSSDHSRNYEQKRDALLLFFAWIQRNFPYLVNEKFKQVQVIFFIGNIKYYDKSRSISESWSLARAVANVVNYPFYYVFGRMVMTLLNHRIVTFKGKVRSAFGR